MTDSESPDIRIEGRPEMRGGIWANFATVSHSPHEFTLDLVRLDYLTQNPIEGILVQRVNMSPLFAKQLINALTRNLDDYARTMPDGFINEEDQ